MEIKRQNSVTGAVASKDAWKRVVNPFISTAALRLAESAVSRAWPASACAHLCLSMRYKCTLFHNLGFSWRKMRQNLSMCIYTLVISCEYKYRNIDMGWEIFAEHLINESSPINTMSVVLIWIMRVDIILLAHAFLLNFLNTTNITE